MFDPTGTSIVDVSDPKNPTLLSHTEMPEGTHSHKVHARDSFVDQNLSPEEQASLNRPIGDLSGA